MFKRLGRLLKVCWGVLGASGRINGASWAPLEGLMGVLGASCQAVGATWAPLERQLGRHGGILRGCWGVWGLRPPKSVKHLSDIIGLRRRPGRLLKG